MENRNELPFRMNCEGYFLNDEGKILAKLHEKEFIMFPGGGVDEGEDVMKAMIREAKEETGLTAKDLSEMGILKIVWGIDWAKTDKQKARFGKFQGDEMHFFTGKVTGEHEITEEEDFWQGERFMNIKEVINKIEETRPFDESVAEYREMQIKYLNKILSEQQN